MALILSEIKKSIGTITFADQKGLNRMSNAFLGEFQESMGKMEAKKARVVVIRAAEGCRVWSAGSDISELPPAGQDPQSYDMNFIASLRLIRRLPVPVIAMINGTCWGGGCHFAFACDMVVATEKASFAITPVKVGVPYATSSLLDFTSVVGLHIAKEMFFTALPLSAERAEKLGLVNHLVPAEELQSFTYTLADGIVQNAPLAIRALKEQFRLLEESMLLSPESSQYVEGLRRKVYESSDYEEGKKAFLQKRPPQFRGK
jgi:methylmalonyl-CoA decarboxylase